MTIREDVKLSLTQKQTLTDMQGDIDWIESQIQKAKRAGVDVDELSSKLSEMKLIREGLIREYGG